MKKILLPLIIAITISFQSNAQVLANNTWIAYNDTTNAMSLYFRFDNDSMAFSGNNVSYTHISRFSEAGNVLTVFDDETGCGAASGTYSFLMSGDTARFTLISDSCTSRVEYFTSHYFVRMLTTVQEYSTAGLRVSPNPAADGIFNLSFDQYVAGMEKLVVYNMEGRIVYETMLPGNSTNFKLDLGQQPAGIYSLVLSGAGKSSVTRVARQ